MPVRIGATAGVLTPIVFGLVVLGCGVLYNNTLRPIVQFTVTPQPAPALKTAIHPGSRDPETVLPRAAPDPAIEHAKAEVVASGLAGWPETAR